tara:strand:- start:789 stop:1463 length:675 start_codon:yes stop_codon:yes gene_type:complete
MNVVKIFSISQSMSSINRYSQINLLHPESVLEHTGFVCLFTYLTCSEINFSCEKKINTGLALMKAVFHDVDEVVTGDIPRPTKYFSEESKNIFDKIASQGINQIISELGIKSSESSQEIENLWRESKNDEEGRIVALSDLAAVVYKIWEEVILLGNKKLVLQGKQVFGYIEDFASSLDSQEINEQHRTVIEDVICQLLNISSKIKDMEDPMIGTLASLNNPEKN